MTSYFHKKIFFIIASCFITTNIAFTKLTILSILPNRYWGYEGHAAVNGSLKRGLSALGVNYNFNPSSFDGISDIVLVPANIETLQAAIELKQQGKIRILLAGPNLVVRPVDHHGILTHPAIDCCIVPSESVKILYEEDAPSLQNRIAVWPAGVDTAYWKPAYNTRTSKNVIVYQKTKDEALCSHVIQLLRAFGWNPIRINYGFYDQAFYKQALINARFAIFLSRTESQGIALAECWSCDVPTFAWDPQEPVFIGEKKWWPVSGAPYITPATGKLWCNFSELELILQNIEEELQRTNPRAWVLEHMSDEASVRQLLAIIKDLEKRLSL